MRLGPAQGLSRCPLDEGSAEDLRSRAVRKQAELEVPQHVIGGGMNAAKLLWLQRQHQAAQVLRSNGAGGACRVHQIEHLVAEWSECLIRDGGGTRQGIGRSTLDVPVGVRCRVDRSACVEFSQSGDECCGEIVVTSEAGDPNGIAADLVAQAEHDPEALAIFITSKPDLAEEVVLESKRLAEDNPIAHQSLTAHAVAFITANADEAHALTNRLAPEHLTIDTGADLRWVKNAGSVFVGHHTPQSMGDYISGPNHVLPTGRNGRVRGGLSVFDFVKVITVQQYTREALCEVGPHTIALAEAEGLKAHAESVRVRMRDR